MKPFFGFVAFALFFACGFYITMKSPQFQYQYTHQSSRSPAAIRKVYDFSNLEGQALNTALKSRLLSGVRVLKDKGDVGVELGHFVLKAQNGQKEFACQRYSKVVLTFYGEGVAVGGEAPQMEVEGNCEISNDVNSIAALWIPVSKIMGEPVADGEFDYHEGKPIKVRFANVSDQWPNMWQLRGVKLHDPSNAQPDVIIDGSELKNYIPKPFLVDFR